jgi:hypothetical protein
MAKATKQVERPKAKRSTTSNGNGIPDRSVEERIRERAYQLYLERGGTVSDPVNDWLRAEREVIVSA